MANPYRIAAIVYGSLLLGFSGYLLLDTFVLGSVKQTGAKEINLSVFTEQSLPVQTEQTTQTTFVTSGTDTAEQTDPEASGTAAENTDTALSSQKTDSAAVTKKTVTLPNSTAEKRTGSTAAASAEKTAQTTAAPAATTAPVTAPPETEPAETEPQILSGDSFYQDENISISLSQYETNETSIYVADVQLCSAQYLKTAFANDTYGKNITAKTSEIAAANNALFAVNGDFYGTHNSGYVIRNGVLYRDIPRAGTDFLCIMADGSFFLTTSDEYAAQDLLDMGAWQCFMFGPRLIENGVIVVDENSEVSRAMPSNPRTAVGIVGDLHYLFVVSDGRTSESDGLSLSELAAFMQSLGAYTAYNLDGGGSSTMWFQGNVINNPTTSGRSIRERSVSDIVYIGY